MASTKMSQKGLARDRFERSVGLKSKKAATAAAIVPTTNPDCTPHKSLIETLIGATENAEALDENHVQSIIERIRGVIDDDNVSIESVTNMISAEPELTERIMAMANSAALNPRRVPVYDLKMAMLRAGLNFVSNAMVAYTVRQLSRRAVMAGMEEQLEVLWKRAVLVASLCYVIAKRFTRINPDMALLTGLLHGVGRLYVITHKTRVHATFKGIAFSKSIEQEWSKDLLKSMLGTLYGEQGTSTTIVETVQLSKSTHAMATLSDVLMAATIIAVYEKEPEEMQRQLVKVRVDVKFGLSKELTEHLLQESSEEFSALQALLI